MSQKLQFQVEQLLQEQGEYIPLEFLLLEGRLIFCDYEAWRNGEIDYLEDALFGDPVQVKDTLQQASAYMQKREWQAYRLSYKVWRSEAEPTLRFSRDNGFNDYFHGCYKKPDDQLQMDLFTDAPASNLANRISQAVLEKNSEEAARLLCRLYDIAPDYVQLAALEHLVEATRLLLMPVVDVEAEMKVLQQTLTPMAEQVLGNESRRLLIPLWQRLSEALLERPYEAERAELHLSYTATQAMDWEIVQQAVEQELAWESDPILLLRHARACDHLYKKMEIYQSWFMICWNFPEYSEAIKDSTDRQLQQQWEKFLAVDPVLPEQAFPAWLLINMPSLTKVLKDPCRTEIESPESYKLLYQLQSIYEQTRHTGVDDTIISLRRELKQANPMLFDLYINPDNS